MTKLIPKSAQSPVLLAGLFFIALLTGCQVAKTPDQVTLKFWQAMADNDLDSARLYVSKDSEALLQAPETNLQEVDFAVGQIVINDIQARVETVASYPDNTKSSFTTFLVKEGDDWRIDYRRTRYSLSGNLFNGLFDSLKNIGENLNKQLEQQMPQIEKEMESFGQELQKQLDNLGKELEKSFPPPKPKPDPYQDSI